MFDKLIADGDVILRGTVTEDGAQLKIVQEGVPAITIRTQLLPLYLMLQEMLGQPTVTQDALAKAQQDRSNGKCKYCKAPIYWVTTTGGNWVAVEPSSVEQDDSVLSGNHVKHNARCAGIPALEADTLIETLDRVIPARTLAALTSSNIHTVGHLYHLFEEGSLYTVSKLSVREYNRLVGWLSRVVLLPVKEPV